MTRERRGRTITIVEQAPVAAMRGYRVADIARAAGLKPVHGGVSQAWLVDLERVPDMLAYSQSRNIAVAVERSEPVTPVAVTPEVSTNAGCTDEPTLFGGAVA